MDESLITHEMKAAVGQPAGSWVCDVDRTGIRMFARSVGHTDPIFYDVEAARAAGYADLPCPPGYLGTPVFLPGAGDPRLGVLQQGPQPSRPLTRGLNGGTEFEYRRDVCAGERLTATALVESFAERTGSLGPMLIVTSRIEYRDEAGELVATERGTGIRY